MYEIPEALGTPERPIIDSELTREQALAQNPEFLCPPEIMELQRIIPVTYIGLTDGLYHRGQIVVDHRLVEDVGLLFEEMLREGFPIAQAVPMVDPRFRWNDEISMQANNSSGFNYRYILGTQKLSRHAFGTAIDINPAFNPCIIYKTGLIQPAGAVYDPARRGTITKDHFIVDFLKKRGWDWGGGWKEYGLVDYQHFEKELEPPSGSLIIRS